MPTLRQLHELYMAADKARRAHLVACGRCTAERPDCRDGDQLNLKFVRLQDQYLAAQRQHK
ncbi:hypothetical protein ACFWIA_28785 [Streptomyces sp. NPDC127068]|uniref:hypothetical protein n=1 Tax=Streptomyces sp. NPDC127068 TaxID=3347127 RepID=UPI0036596FDA